MHLKGFADGKLALAAADYDTNTGTTAGAPGGTTGLTAARQLRAINTADLDIAAVTTPALLTNKFSAGLGYTTKMYQQYRATIGLGAAYEMGTTNADVDNYAFWLKMAFSF